MKKKYNKFKFIKSIEEKIENRYHILIVIIIMFFTILLFGLYNITINKNEYYKNEVEKKSYIIKEGQSAPRGRIYDRNHNLLVDNVAIKTIYYKKPKNISSKKEIELAYKVAKLIDVDHSKLLKVNLKEFWLHNNISKGNSKIKSGEWKLLEERKITMKDIERMKKERITNEEIDSYNEMDKKAAYIFYLMNKGYYYDEKIIKNKDVTDKEYAIIAASMDVLNGFNTKLDWERVYLYGDVFKSILGKVSSNETGIPYELKDYYLDKGYKLDDRVGISYLEYQYEEVLKGKKEKYQLNKNGEYKLLEEGKRGNDIVLSIDIKLQEEVEKILKEEIIKTKKEYNTDYYDKSFVVITDPITGEILAMSGKQVIETKEKGLKIYDYTPGVITTSVTAGSVVKGASMIVGYKNNVIEIGSVKNDRCIKIKATPLKCSWRYLGNINDIDALRYSSNTYQFNIAIDIGKGNYEYNKALKIDDKAFEIYRNVYKEFGLGTKTKVDLPNEGIGYKGISKLPGHLFDFSIGQYDTYTPIQISQYINTIANNGSRIKPSILKEVYKPTKGKKLEELIYKNEVEVLNEVEVDKKYINRVKEGFIEVLKSGTGRNFMGKIKKPAGKTGTSESFLDTDNDNIVDTETITNTFAGYAPYDDPKMSIVVISPNVSFPNPKKNYKTNVNQRISSKISEKFFEIYK